MAKKTGAAKAPVKYKDNAERFRVVGGKRVGKAVKALEMVGNLAGQNYDYDDEQLGRISEALTTALNNALMRLKNRSTTSAPVFEL